MYAIGHDGLAYGPDGVIKGTNGVPLKAEHIAAFNTAVEAQELAHLHTGPERVFAYVKHSGWQGQKPNRTWSHSGIITTGLGTELGRAWVGSEYRDNFGGRRAAITVRIFGTLYHGWWFSDFDYCRLKRAKNQKGLYA